MKTMPKKENRVKLRLRLVAFLIDISFIFALSQILFFILQLFSFYIGTTSLFIFISLIYFPLTTILFKGTPGKILCGLKVTYTGNQSFIIVIILRELVYKIFLFFVLPAYLINVFQVNEYFDNLNGIFHFIFYEYTVSVFVLITSIVLLLLYLVFKQTWYDKLAGTKIEKTDPGYKRLKLFYISFIIILISVSGIKVINYVNHGNIYNPIVPKQSKYTIAPYVLFLNQQKEAKEYIFKLFEKYDIVILCERLHYEMTQYDFLYDIISDQRFIDNVGAIFTETGGVNYQIELDSLMNAHGLSEKELDDRIAHLMKNISISWPVWDKTNLFTHLKSLYKLNQNLPEDKKVNHYFTDIDFTWDRMNDADYQKNRRILLRDRDKIMKDNFSIQYEKNRSSILKRNKCLVIMNYRHGFGPVRKTNGELLELNAGALIMEKYPETSANVLINTVKLSFDVSKYGVSVSSIQNGIWDNAFSEIGNKSLGFDFKNSPFGLDEFDMALQPSWADFNYQDVFTGFVFYKSLEDHITSMGFPAILNNNFEEKMLERARLIDNKAYLEYSEKVRLLKENEIVLNYVNYSELLPKKHFILDLIILISGLILSTWKFIANHKSNKI
jgi:uncharacterized RDD family membrane protein YckC